MTSAAYQTTPTLLPGTVTTDFSGGVASVAVAPQILEGHGSPTGVVLASVGSFYTDVDSGDVYANSDGTDTGWATIGSTAPTNIPLTALATQAAHTFVANDTGGAAAPTARTVAQVKTALDVASTYSGTGSPEGAQAATVNSVYFDLTDTGAPVMYIKTTGSGNTGWVIYPAP